MEINVSKAKRTTPSRLKSNLTYDHIFNVQAVENVTMFKHLGVHVYVLLEGAHR